MSIHEAAMQRHDQEPGPSPHLPDKLVSRDDKVLSTFSIVAGILLVVVIVVITLTNLLD